MNKSRDEKSKSSKAIHESATDSIEDKSNDVLASRLLSFKKKDLRLNPAKPHLLIPTKSRAKAVIPKLKFSTKELTKKSSFEFDSPRSDKNTSSRLRLFRARAPCTEAKERLPERPGQVGRHRAAAAVGHHLAVQVEG